MSYFTLSIFFHIFLKDSGIPAPDCVELFSYKVYGGMPIQSYVTDEELGLILGVIDTDTNAGLAAPWLYS